MTTAEKDSAVGFETESKYRLRLVGYPTVLGAQSQVEWNGKRYSIDGEPKIYNGSRRTAHVDYVIKRHCQVEQSEGDFRRFASAIHQVACDV